MVIMDAYYSSSRLIELWQNIDQLHLSYLEMEDSPEKIEQRIKLEDCIREYLCIAAHSQKFVFRETGDVLYRSACNKRDFSGYKASTGWNAVQLYAGNLLSQPWRKEYRQIKTYCGFYKHQIEANLVGAEVMFEAMGYKHSSGGILMLDGPICPDRVTNVSKDCLIAYVECQIIKAIWEELSQTFNITWLEVLEFRKTHLCSPEQSIRALTYQYHHKQYQDRNYTQGSDNFYNNYNTINNNNNNSSSSARCLANYQDIVHPPITGYNHIPVPGGMLAQQLPTTIPPPPPPPPPLPPTSQYLYGSSSNGCCGYGGNYGTYTTPPPPHQHYSYPLPVTYHQTPPIKSSPTNGYYCGGGNGYIPQPVYDYHQHHHHLHHHRVPTGQLIELDAHDGGCGSGNSNNSQTNNNNNNISHVNNNNSSSNNKNQEKSVKNCDKDGVFEDWDYVYKNLESQGYTKDLGERGDILYQQSDEKQQRKKPTTTKVTNLNDVLNNLSVNDRPLKINEALERYEQEQPTRNVVQQQHERKPSQSSSYENLSEHKKVPTTVTKSTKLKISPPQQQQQQQQKEKSKTKNDNNINNRWECKTCTFLNDNSHDICEMCSKSRTNIEQQMEIGGAECSKCTLVNPKDKNVCQACGASLKNSPTYI